MISPPIDGKVVSGEKRARRRRSRAGAPVARRRRSWLHRFRGSRNRAGSRPLTVGPPGPSLSAGDGAGDHDRGAGRHRVVVASETLRFHGVVRLQIVGPAKGNRLEPELGVDLERALRVADRDRVTDLVAAAGEVLILVSRRPAARFPASAVRLSKPFGSSRLSLMKRTAVSSPVVGMSLAPTMMSS